MRLVCAVLLIAGLAVPARAQDERGWSFSGSFRGSSNADGVVTRVEPMLGYIFDKHFSAYGGIPYYFVHTAADTTATTGGAATGIGNAFAGLRFGIARDALNYSSTLELTAPTGDESKGFSTGHLTADWTNHLSRAFSSWTPFGSIGLANTVSDTAFFIRPFSAYGLVAHFEGGTTYDVSPVFGLGASAYAVKGSGEQTIVSKIIRRDAAPVLSAVLARRIASGKSRIFETQIKTVSEAGIADDHGFSAWLDVNPNPVINFSGGYSRSMSYDFNTLFFGIGFHIGK